MHRGRALLLALVFAPAVCALDQAALKALVDRCRTTDTDALRVVHGGKVVVDTTFGRRRGPVDVKSITKSVVNLAMGVLVQQRRLESVDVPAHAFFPEWESGPKRSITLRHLMSHTSGLVSEFPPLAIYQAKDWSRFALTSPLGSVPGSKYFYSNRAVALLSGVVRRITGEPLDRFTAREVLAPLGITRWRWRKDPAGNPASFTGLRLGARDLEKIGRLVMQRGLWEGRRLLPERWLEESLKPSQTHEPRFGLLWWRIPRRGVEAFPGADAVPADPTAATDAMGFYARGYLGNYLVVVPEEDLIVVRLRRMRERTRYVFPNHFVDFVSTVKTLVD